MACGAVPRRRAQASGDGTNTSQVMPRATGSARFCAGWDSAARRPYRRGKCPQDAPTSEADLQKAFHGEELGFRLGAVQKDLARLFEHANVDFLRSIPQPKSFTDYLGRKLFLFLMTLQGLGAFALITLGVMLRKRGVAGNLMQPRIRQEIRRSGVALLPMFFFLALGLGFLVVGQTVAALSKLGEMSYLGTTVVVVVVRELGPLVTAMMLLARVGTANVIELATSRALGEVEVLEALGIDPIHYLIVPRVAGMMAAMFALTIYLILGALVSGYLFTFLQNVPLEPADYCRQLAAALSPLDFVFLVLKTLLLGFVIAIVTCYHGLAQPLQLDEVSQVTVRAVTQGVLVPIFIDAVFIVVYLVT